MDFKLTKSILNLRVSTAETIPTTPGAENDVVILSAVPMKNWMLSPDAPTGAPRTEGDVWLQYSVKGDTFNILKNQVFEIALIAAYQFVGEVWNKVGAVNYRNGKWNEWNHIVFDGTWNGDYKFIALTSRQDTNYEAGVISINNDSNPATLSITAGWGAYIEGIDVTNYKTLEICSEVSGGTSGWIYYGLATDTAWRDSSSGSFVKVKSHNKANRAKAVETFDVSNLSGVYYFKVNSYHADFKMWSLRLLV